jgi:hypothetical protein
MLSGADEVALEAPACEGPLPHPPDFTPSAWFLGLLTSCFQSHALGWDIPPVPPPAAGYRELVDVATLVQLFGSMLGYMREVVHLYREFGGSELLMRRVVGGWG